MLQAVKRLVLLWKSKLNCLHLDTSMAIESLKASQEGSSITAIA